VFLGLQVHDVSSDSVKALHWQQQQQQCKQASTHCVAQPCTSWTFQTAYAGWTTFSVAYLSLSYVTLTICRHESYHGGVESRFPAPT
jgi:hypothetical protein